MKVSFDIDGPPKFLEYLALKTSEEIQKLTYFGWCCQETINYKEICSKEEEKMRAEIAKYQEQCKIKDSVIESNNRLVKDLTTSFVKTQEESSSFWTKKFDATFDKSKDRRIEELENQLISKQSSIVFKGQVGEDFVKEILTQNFSSFEITNTTKNTNCGDFQISNLDGEFVAIECKNKATITAADVAKSIKDILHLKKTTPNLKFVGYLFVSLKTKNIPKKGEMLFESIADVPVIWLAIDVEKSIPRFINLLFQYHKNFQNKPINFDQIRVAFDKINQVRKKVHKLLGTIEILRLDVADFDHLINDIWQGLNFDISS